VYGLFTCDDFGGTSRIGTREYGKLEKNTGQYRQSGCGGVCVLQYNSIEKDGMCLCGVTGK
jgi:hypothetical protein